MTKRTIRTPVFDKMIDEKKDKTDTKPRQPQHDILFTREGFIQEGSRVNFSLNVCLVYIIIIIYDVHYNKNNLTVKQNHCTSERIE